MRSFHARGVFAVLGLVCLAGVGRAQDAGVPSLLPLPPVAPVAETPAAPAAAPAAEAPDEEIKPLIGEADPEFERLLAEEEEIERSTREHHETPHFRPGDAD